MKVGAVNICFACVCYVMFPRVFFFSVYRAMGVTDDVKSDLSKIKVLCFGYYSTFLSAFTDLIHSQ